MTTMPIDWSAFRPDNAIGDPGRQPGIRSVSDVLNVGVPDTALDFLTTEPLEIRACSSRGWSHRFSGTPRQDSYSLLVMDDFVVAAVADGVSEGDHSQVAAETAARSACKLVADQVSRGAVDWVQIARRLSQRIIEEAEYRQIAAPVGLSPTAENRRRACLRTMATTLIVAVVWRHPTHQGFQVDLCVVAGDSAAYLASGDRLIPVGGGKSSTDTVTSTRVRPLPGPVEPEEIALHLRPGEALVLGTDGIGDLVDGSREAGQELAARWASPPTIDRFLLDVNTYCRSYDDDRTAVGLWACPGVVLPEPPAPQEAAEAPGQAESEPAGSPGTALGDDIGTDGAPSPGLALPEAPDGTLPVGPDPDRDVDGEPAPEAASPPAAPLADPSGWRPNEYPRSE